MKRNRAAQHFLCALVFLLFPLCGVFSQTEISDEAASDFEPVADFSLLPETTATVRGSAGGGFPGDFFGDFSVSGGTEENPFAVSFSHSSRNGFGTHEAADGYFCTATLFSAEKTVSAGAFSVTAGGAYRRNGTGLQDRSPCFFDVQSQNVSGTVFVKRNFSGGFSVRAGTGGAWYSRYAGIRGDGGSYSRHEKKAGVFLLEPEAEFSWKGSRFWAGANSRMSLEAAAGSFVSSGTEQIFRADASVFAGLRAGIAEISVQGGAACGNETGSKSGFIPFFSAGIMFQEEERAGAQSFSAELRGGLDSRLALFSETEERFAFSALGTLPGETTDWFAAARVQLPVPGGFSVCAKTCFRKTAFGNGAWEADYRRKSEAGLFSLRERERTLFTTGAELCYFWNSFTFGIGWNENWIHVPSDEFRASVDGSLSFSSEDGKLGFCVCAQEFISSVSDKWPVLGGGVQYAFSPSFSASVSLRDMLKLFSGKDREYMETGYLVRAGSAEILARFSF